MERDSLPQSRLVLDLLSEAIGLLQLVELVVEWDDALGGQVFDLLGAFRLPVSDVGGREGSQGAAGPDGGFDGRVEVGFDDPVACMH